MTIPKEIIGKAIEGGWNPERYGYSSPSVKLVSFGPHREESWEFSCEGANDKTGTFYVHFTRIALDPTFWQALGKALEWKVSVCTDCGRESKEGCCEDKDGFTFTVERWRHKARMFYDLILTGGDTDTFWEEIISN